MTHRTTPPPVARTGLLLEREQELEELAGAIAAADRGAGQIVVVRGVPGAGKTHLMGHGRRAAHRAGLQVLEARGAELEQGFAFGVVRQLLEPAVVGADEEERTLLFADAAALASAET